MRDETICATLKFLQLMIKKDRKHLTFTWKGFSLCINVFEFVLREIDQDFLLRIYRVIQCHN